MRSKKILAAALISLAAGCATTSGPNKNAVDVSFSGDTRKAFVAGLQPVDVTVKRKGEDKSLPAQCNLTSEKYSASFAAPNTVNVPV